MNFVNFSVVKEPEPSTDWRIFGDITDDAGNILGTFGQDGTSVNIWWSQQDADFQSSYVLQFASVMANEIVNGTAE